jgi:hypothetical protein
VEGDVTGRRGWWAMSPYAKSRYPWRVARGSRRAGIVSSSPNLISDDAQFNRAPPTHGLTIFFAAALSARKTARCSLRAAIAS